MVDGTSLMEARKMLSMKLYEEAVEEPLFQYITFSPLFRDVQNRSVTTLEFCTYQKTPLRFSIEAGMWPWAYHMVHASQVIVKP